MLNWSVNIISKRPWLIAALLIIPTVGRMVQLAAFGPTDKVVYWLLEIPVEGARILLVLLLIGQGGFGEGVAEVKGIFRSTGNDWDTLRNTVARGFRLNRKPILGYGLLFVFVAVAGNMAIDWISGNEQLINDLRRSAVLGSTFNAETLTLCLKNISIIPFTIFFEVWLALKLLMKT